MRYSLVQTNSYPSILDECCPKDMFVGCWVQDHFGTLETARESARKTEEVNGNKIKIHVCKFRFEGPPVYGPNLWQIATE